MKASFSVNLYDKDGDCFNECILLYVGDSTILKFKNVNELNEFAHCILDQIIPEINENWGG